VIDPPKRTTCTDCGNPVVSAGLLLFWPKLDGGTRWIRLDPDPVPAGDHRIFEHFAEIIGPAHPATKRYRTHHCPVKEPEMTRCKYCGKEVLWVTMVASQKKAPLDPVRVDTGNIVCMGDKAKTLSRAAQQKYLAAGNLLYMNHHATCKEWIEIQAKAKRERTHR
jgi:hypothetical protein